MNNQDELKHFGKSLYADRKATCRGCGSVWYEEHYKNGFCYDCQNNGVMDDHLNHKPSQYIIVHLVFILIIMASIAMGAWGIYNLVINLER